MASLPAQQPEDYTVSAATIRDAHAIRRLEQIVFPIDAYTYLSLTSLLMWPGGANYKLTDRRGELVGFVAGSPNWSTHTDWIVTLGVHPLHQRRGLGQLLLATCEEHLSQATLALTVRASNQPAIHLYERAGYSRAYIEPRYYNDGEDGIVMHKTRYEPDET
ncbi:MAG: GNAT family N-acetyltransferase [Chloroflexota bacterium]